MSIMAKVPLLARAIAVALAMVVAVAFFFELPVQRKPESEPERRAASVL